MDSDAISLLGATASWILLIILILTVPFTPAAWPPIYAFIAAGSAIIFILMLSADDGLLFIVSLCITAMLVALFFSNTQFSQFGLAGNSVSIPGSDFQECYTIVKYRERNVIALERDGVIYFYSRDFLEPCTVDNAR